ncbi:hypothetical protein [Bauldia litoralis]|uniref:Sulfotransferase family protein n=1 Tax=Bauldia litoralis TaxID=665467 RepID=A0A1G6CVI2_9HYPH|nr:hypothetical protein [Bauldia litoralis]SDB36933.1 hypothetical protein SAMN02982931_02811 [Bauldia litoralis]
MIGICSTQRSGTTVFRQMLSVAGAVDLGEIFHLQAGENGFYAYLKNAMEQAPDAIHPQMQPTVFRSYLDALKNRCPEGQVVIDIKIDHAAALDFGYPGGTYVSYRVLREINAKIIRVHRMNRLRVVLSHLIAKKTGVWSQGRSQGLAPETINVPVELLIGQLVADMKAVEEIRLRIPWGLTVIYEHLFDPNGNVAPYASEVVSALCQNQTSAADIQAGLTMSRQNPEPISDILANYDEVKKALLGTEFAWMLEFDSLALKATGECGSAKRR